MLKYNIDEGYWYEYHKLSNNQTAAIMFVEWRYDARTDYYVCFAIADKKRQIRDWFNETGNGDLDCKVTGKCGTEGLAWAFREIENAITFLHSETAEDRNIIITASDSRRFKIYEHFLKRLGFKKQVGTGIGMTLRRKI